MDGSGAGPEEDFLIRRREDAAVAPTTGPVSRAPDSGGLVLADTEAFGSGPNVNIKPGFTFFTILQNNRK